MRDPMPESLRTDTIKFEYPDAQSGLIYMPGDGSAVSLSDGQKFDVGFGEWSSVERAVFIARLRAWADEAERSGDPLLGLAHRMGSPS